MPAILGRILPFVPVVNMYLIVLVVVTALSAPLSALEVPAFLAAEEEYPSSCPKKAILDLLAHDEVRQAEEVLKNAQQRTPSSRLAVELAKVYLIDQRTEEAFCEYLNALDLIQDAGKERSDQEKALFDTLERSYRQIYRGHGAESEYFKEEVHNALRQHPNFSSLLYFKAACEANENRFGPFFESLYRAYLTFPECYIATKMKAVLWARLYELSAVPAVREARRKHATDLFANAFFQYPQDASLLLKALFLSPPEERRELMSRAVLAVRSLKEAPRKTDVVALIEVCVEMQEYNEACQLLERARTWYTYSRSLEELAKAIEEAHGRAH